MYSAVTASTLLFDQNKVNPIFLALIVVGLFIKFALSDVNLSNDGTTGPASSLIWGYGLIVFSLIGLIIVNVNPGSDEWSDIKELPWILILTITLMLWVIAINIQFFTQINMKTVPDEFFMWSNYSTILLICLIGISIYQYALSRSASDNAKSFSHTLQIYSGLVFLFNLIAVTIQQVILNCFYVDG
jgi:hypothetical protein